MSTLYFTCPHCSQYVEVKKKELNCRIFRHGCFKDSFVQIPPHLCKTECDRLANEQLIYGCGKPFEVVGDTDETMEAVICDYK